MNALMELAQYNTTKITCKTMLSKQYVLKLRKIRLTYTHSQMKNAGPISRLLSLSSRSRCDLALDRSRHRDRHTETNFQEGISFLDIMNTCGRCFCHYCSLYVSSFGTLKLYIFQSFLFLKIMY